MGSDVGGVGGGGGEGGYWVDQKRSGTVKGAVLTDGRAGS